jgi:hypothetical protein
MAATTETADATCDVRCTTAACEITDSREITDSLVDLLIHKISRRAEKRVDKELLDDLKRVAGKTGVLFRIAEGLG